MISVVVTGAAGRMGTEVCKAVQADLELQLVGVVDRKGSRDIFGLKTNSELGLLLGDVNADVLVDFTVAKAAVDNVRLAAEAGLHAVVGTTGLGDNEVRQLQALAEKTKKNILLAPNFAIGAVVMMDISRRIAKYFDRVEVIEFHHDRKVDSPSGTAIATARMIGEMISQSNPADRPQYPGARGATVAGVPVHSVRLPGLVAHQEVIFGLKGQTLTVRHDSTDRTSFMPGVVLAIKEIARHPGVTIGLDKFLGLGKS